MVSGRAVVRWPFCNRLAIKASHKRRHLEPKITRISASSETTCYRVPESYEVLSGCSACAKSKKEVHKAFDTGVTKELGHEERLERLREPGLALRIAIKHKKEATVQMLVVT